MDEKTTQAHVSFEDYELTCADYTRTIREEREAHAQVIERLQSEIDEARERERSLRAELESLKSVQLQEREQLASRINELEEEIASLRGPIN